MTSYIVVDEGRLISSLQPPVGLMPIVHGASMLQPQYASELHRTFSTWAAAGFSPGAITPQRVFIGPEAKLAFAFDEGELPQGLMVTVGAAPDLAAWLVLLDKWMDTGDVVAGARAVWSPLQMAAALPFITPAFLPPVLVSYPPENWVRVARAVAVGLAPADGGARVEGKQPASV